MVVLRKKVYASSRPELIHHVVEVSYIIQSDRYLNLE
jgi:hypothetical protein